MILNPAVQHRVKHFDLLLARELVLLGRAHEQNLITYTKLEKSIRRDSDQLSNPNLKKPSKLPPDEFYHKMPSYIPEKTRLSISSTNNTQIDETLPQISPRRYRRTCFKPHRLPPIAKATTTNRKKRPSNDLHWVTSFQPEDTGKENISDTSTMIDEELPKAPLPELTRMQKQIHSFMGNLPTYKGVQGGFDNFAPSSLYSTRATVVMR
jgi:hypothetical protein